MKRTFFALAVMLLATACATTRPAPTSTPLPALPPLPIEARFDGDKCIYSGQTELPVGEHSILVIDNSGLMPEFGCRRYLDGNTYKDLMDLQPAPGELFDRPSFVTDVKLLGNVRDDSRGGRVYTYSFGIAGEHGCHFYIPVGKNKRTLGMWSYKNN